MQQVSCIFRYDNAPCLHNSSSNSQECYANFLLEEYVDTDRYLIMCAHRPESFYPLESTEQWKIDLILSGHLHGGQVILPFLGGLYGGDQGWFPEYVHGMYEKGNFQMFVTSGLGSNRQKLPRFNNPPEVAVLTIR